MSGSTFREKSKLVVHEVEAALERVPEEQVSALEDAVVKAGDVFVTGEGRSGLIGRCFAMRLCHLGLRCHVVGETSTPPVGRGDLLVAISGTGESAVTRARAELAAEAGASVAAVTAALDSPLGGMADLMVCIPAPTGGGAEAASEQYGGSLFEQCALLALDAVVLALQQRLRQSREQIAARHATVE